MRLLIQCFILAWGVAMLAIIACAYPPLPLAFLHYAAASIYLTLLVAAVPLGVVLFLWFWSRRLPP